MNDQEVYENTAGEQASAPAEEEVPFVPYALEAFGETDVEKKRFRRYLILIGVIVLLVIVYIVMRVAKQNNFYRETISSLQFDYRSGEYIMEDTLEKTPKGDRAEAIASTMENHAVRIDAIQYYLNPDRSMNADISEYNFTHNGEGDTAEIEIGTRDSVRSKKETVRRTSRGVQVLNGSDWEDASGISLPHLYDYCFSVSSHNGIVVNPCTQAYETYVNNRSMICEIWLIQAGSSYYTVYRYYSGSTLKAIRVLNSSDNLMCVYEIKSYAVI